MADKGSLLFDSGIYFFTVVNYDHVECVYFIELSTKVQNTPRLQTDVNMQQ